MKKSLSVILTIIFTILNFCVLTTDLKASDLIVLNGQMIAQVTVQENSKPQKKEAFVNINSIISRLAPNDTSTNQVDKKRSIDLNVPFEMNNSSLKLSSKKQLDELANALKSGLLKNTNFLIAGHTGSSGAKAYNKFGAVPDN